MNIKYIEYFNYYLELERDFFKTESYVTIDEDNYGTFSIQYNRIYQSVCSEIDCLLKELCRELAPQSKADSINKYCTIIQSKFQYFNIETVYFYKARIELQPWKCWEDKKAPTWWTNYNKVKHHRMEIESASKKPYYKFANQENLLNALAALYIVEQYYIYSFNFKGQINITQNMKLNPYLLEDEINKKKGNALLRNKSHQCCMKQWQDGYCYMGFMGQDFFEIKNLLKIMENREVL